MRCEVGSVVFLFNENDGEFLTKVSSKLKRGLKLIICERKKYERIDNDFSIIFCPPKSNKLDILIQKCTEIGVKNFVPVISQHTDRLFYKHGSKKSCCNHAGCQRSFRINTQRSVLGSHAT